MPNFIREGYGPNALKISYNLFYVPTHGMGAEWRGFCDYENIGPGSQIAHKLADTLQRTAERDNPTQWTVHEHGHTVLAKALRILHARGVNLGNQTVFFANALVNVQNMNRLCEATDMQIAKSQILLNNYSIRQTWFSFNFASEPLLSLCQLSQANSNQTEDSIFIRAYTRVKLLAGFTLPAAVVGLPAWGLFMMVLAASNLRPNTNKKVINTPALALRHLRGKL